MAASFLAAPCALLAQDAPKILLDQPLRAVEYQLGRLTNEELVLVERKDNDVKYRPVYVAILTRKGVPQQFRDEAVTALVTMDKASRSRVLLEALAKVPDRRLRHHGKVDRHAGEPAGRLLAQGARDFRRGARRRVWHHR